MPMKAYAIISEEKQENVKEQKVTKEEYKIEIEVAAPKREIIIPHIEQPIARSAQRHVVEAKAVLFQPSRHVVNSTRPLPFSFCIQPVKLPSQKLFLNPPPPSVPRHEPIFQPQFFHTPHQNDQSYHSINKNYPLQSDLNSYNLKPQKKQQGLLDSIIRPAKLQAKQQQSKTPFKPSTNTLRSNRIFKHHVSYIQSKEQSFLSSQDKIITSSYMNKQQNSINSFKKQLNDFNKQQLINQQNIKIKQANNQQHDQSHQQEKNSSKDINGKEDDQQLSFFEKKLNHLQEDKKKESPTIGKRQPIFASPTIKKRLPIFAGSKQSEQISNIINDRIKSKEEKLKRRNIFVSNNIIKSVKNIYQNTAPSPLQNQN